MGRLPEGEADRHIGRAGEPPPLPSGALAAALGRMLVSAHELGVAWANETHLLMGLLHDPGNRASEALLERRLDRDELIARLAVLPTARQNGKPNTLSLDGLRNLGMLDHAPSRGWGGRIGRWLTSGGHGSPVVPTVRSEAQRQAVRLGHSSVTTAHLLLSILVLDDQIAIAATASATGSPRSTAPPNCCAPEGPPRPRCWAPSPS